MHERKKLMADLSDGFVGLPGGYGTLEEVAEMTTWTQLGIRESSFWLRGARGADVGAQIGNVRSSLLLASASWYEGVRGN